ncbi:MAG: DNA-binding protein HU-beta [Microgenomates group bacterium LiPW_31]|uniref:DNA-binding protein n=1 Tax=Candidatus Shapirobacteria bacterium CG_4_9_14_0_2_um_filter_39_11 TaxID=1974478 RepID=A0A2M8ESY8_9BACT|nr:MAG: DNA-binding protein [Candidatus Shapirobacteria bacterium CG_4_9_14_0_2_um_filter_39_11]TSC54508.1 MAG: DNA-binding protein HU-beta [Microgenomates group bacterium LiPW_31]
MTKKQIISLVATKAHLTKKAATEAVENFLGEIAKALKKGEKVVLSGFGTFRVTRVKDKPVIVPGTGQKQMVKAHRAPRFSPGKPLKKEVR